MTVDFIAGFCIGIIAGVFSLIAIVLVIAGGSDFNG